MASLRERCAHDADAVAYLLVPHADRTPSMSAFADLRLLPTTAELVVCAPAPGRVARSEELVPSASLHALLEAAAEAVRNADEHAQVDEIILGAEPLPDGIRVSVRDSGVGFDASKAGFGVNHSILRRCREAGIDVDLRSAPGQGTAVVLTFRSPAGAASLPDRKTRRHHERPSISSSWWRLAGVGESISLLRRVADGTVSAADGAVRRHSRVLEAALRAIISIDPGLTFLKPWLILASARARSRGLMLTLRGGAVDAPGVRAAARLGSLLLSLLSRAEPDDEIVVGLFGSADAPHYTVTGPSRLGSGIEPDLVAGPYAVRSCVRGDRWIAEAVYAR